MKTYIAQGVFHAKTQISHNGGEINGNVAMFRRMGVIQHNGESVDIPYISGNAIRGKLRDVSAKITLDMLGDDDKPHAVTPQVFQFLFSGGTLTSGSNKDGDIDAFKQIKQVMPHASLFGGAFGNAILQGKMKVNPLIPVAKETAHLIPKEFVVRDMDDLPEVATYLQLEMFTRRENLKDAQFEPYIQTTLDAPDAETSQMIYHVETLQAGTPLYWKVILEDVTPEEFAAFVAALGSFSTISVVGGKGAVGFGQIEMSSLEWTEIEKTGNQVYIDRNLSTANLYEKFLNENKNACREALTKLFS